MSRTIEITLPPARTDALVERLKQEDGVVGISLQRGGSLRPPGDVLTLQTTNEGLMSVARILSELGIGQDNTIVTSEPMSLIAPTYQNGIDRESNEGSWEEMASLLRRETNISSNYVLAMALSGAVAAAGLWTDTLHIVIGAMIIAPGFEPLLRLPIGLVALQRASVKQGLTASGGGYLAMALGAALAVLLLQAIEPSAGDLRSRSWVQYWSSLKPTGVLIALLASAAGAVIVAAHRSVLSAGVMVALALVPGMSIAGMALVMGDLSLAGQGLLRWAVDAVCVSVAAAVVFWLKRELIHRRRALG